MPGLIVFDTCTKPVYYRDVHQLLALPEGSFLCYDYEEDLFSPAALKLFKEAKPHEMPFDAFLFYGQFKDFEKGSPDPQGVFGPEDSLIVTTRYAQIRNIAIEERRGSAGQSRSNVKFHMELMGFPDPNSPIISDVIRILSERRELPFSKWVATVPEGVDVATLRERSTTHWGAIVERMSVFPSQFRGDVFWRLSIEEISRIGAEAIRPIARDANRFGEVEFRADFPLVSQSRYRARIVNMLPADVHDLPADTTVSLAETDPKLLVLPSTTIELRRNDGAQVEFRATRIDDVVAQLTKLSVETRINESATAHSGYPIGSSADVTCAVKISGHRTTFALLYGALGAVLIGLSVAPFRDGEISTGVFTVLGGMIFVLLASIVWTGKYKIPGL